MNIAERIEQLRRNGRLACCSCGADLGSIEQPGDPDCRACLEREAAEEDVPEEIPTFAEGGEVPEGFTSATAPSAWASYLINGDDSGLEDNDRAQCDAWIRDYMGGRLPVDCRDAGFMWHHDARPWCPFGADCQEYVFQEGDA